MSDVEPVRTALFLVNPQSAGGRTGRKIAEIRALAASCFTDFHIRETEYQGHATEIAASCSGVDLLVSVGGDGTANEVVNGLARLDATMRPCLGILPAGTGSDLVKTLGMPSGLEEAIQVLATGEARAADWMRVRLIGPDGALDQICINVAGFGLNGEIVRVVNRSGKRFGGKITFGLATVQTALSYRHPIVTIRYGVDGVFEEWTGPLASVFLANGSYCGGGMWVGPEGRLDDGLVEMTILPKTALLRQLRHGAKLYNGHIGDVPGIIRASISELRAETSSGDVLIDLDGEQPGRLPLSMVVEPGAIRVVGSWRIV